jgi:hypothetical protein
MIDDTHSWLISSSECYFTILTLPQLTSILPTSDTECKKKWAKTNECNINYSWLKLQITKIIYEHFDDFHIQYPKY